MLPLIAAPAALATAFALPAVLPPAAAQGTGSDLDAASSPEAFVHESWTVEDGLPVNSVTALLQSRDGYLWIATYDGLVRFDGARFTVFNSSNSPGLPGNRIVELHETRDGALWLRTPPNQLVRFQGGVFTHFGPEHGVADRVWALYVDSDGTLWIGTEQGLGFIRDGHLVRVAPETIRGRVRAIVRRRDGSIWAGLTTGGLFRVERGEAVPAAAGSALAAEPITALYEDPRGQLWIGTEAGVWRYGERPERIASTDGVVEFRASPRTEEIWLLTESKVIRIEESGRAHVLDRAVPSWRPGLLVPDESGRMLYGSGSELHREGRRIASLPQAAVGRQTELRTIAALLLDHEGSIWLGTHGAGLHRLKAATFTTYSEREGLYPNVYSVYEDGVGAVWIGTLDGGTYRLASGQITRMPEEQGVPLTVSSFLEDREGRFWLGSTQGLRVCARPGLRCAPPSPNPVGSLHVLAIHEEPGGTLWFGTESGLFRLNGGDWTRFTAADGASDYPVRAFRQTRDGALWIGTAGDGLIRHGQGGFTRITAAEGLPFDLVRSLYEDTDGWLWVGTEGRGLARLDPREWVEGRRGHIIGYGMADGLFDEVIHQILEDDHGRLWMSSNRGIFWVARAELLALAAGRIARLHATGYTERDGLRNREANGGSQPAGVKTRDGRLWFPTQDGVAVVDPSRVQGNAIPPNVVIEQVRAADSVLLTGGAPMDLGVDQRDLAIDYTALSFLAPANVRFRYRLEGYDRDWVDAGNRRTAYYTRVPPGRYTFRVVASNNDGIWNEEGAALTIGLAPHFWETATFRLLAMLALGTLLTGGVGWRIRGLRRRTGELERLVEERTAALRERERQLETQNVQLGAQAEQLQELDHAKSRFFANVSHEFRTPLTLTIGPLEDLRTRLHDGPDEIARNNADLALRNARRLLRLVNQILDVAKLEAGQMQLHRRPLDLVPFVRGLASAFQAIADRKGVRLEVRTPASLHGTFDGDAMEKILTNLLSNAVKFTPAGGAITVTVATAGERVELRVSDTGPGIPPEHQPHLFERFYQADESNRRAEPGTGIGLALTRELVELHGGSIAVASPSHPSTSSRLARDAEGASGVTFIVTLPTGDAVAADPLALEPLAADPAVAESAAAIEPVESRDPAAPVGPVPVRRAGDGAEAEDVPTLLIVDDSADLRGYVRAHFERRFRIFEAADGTEGVEVARRELPDMIVSDVMMPGTDGHELCRLLRASPETDFLPIILLTAQAESEQRIAGLEHGADDYIVKPFEMRVLEARIENLISSRRRLRERFAPRLREAPYDLRETTGALRPDAGAPRGPALNPSDAAFVERVRAAIEAHFADPDFGVAELARAVFQDRSHLFRRTRQIFGESPSELIRRARLEHAASLLAEGTGTVADVAYAVGFNSVSYFTRAFHDTFGMTPAAYRRQAVSVQPGD